MAAPDGSRHAQKRTQDETQAIRHQTCKPIGSYWRNNEREPGRWPSSQI